MEKTPSDTPVGVDDPYAHVDRCDHLTDEGRCRFAVEHGDCDPSFADARSREGFRCPVVYDSSDTPGGRATGDATREESALPGPWDWADCPHFRSRSRDRACVRCGLEEHRVAHGDERPLLEEHHLSYARDASSRNPDRRPGAEQDENQTSAPAHEITVTLCRWCHAKVHNSWARVDDDASPDPAAVARREGRRSREQAELEFSSAADRRDDGA